MPVTTESVDIACDIEAVFDLIANSAKLAPLADNFKEIRNHPGGLAQVGDEWVVVSRFMGRDIEAQYTCLESDPPTNFVVRNESPSAEIHITWTLEPIDGGTRVTFHSDGEPKGFFATIALAVVKGNYDKVVRDLLQNLKSTLEA